MESEIIRFEKIALIIKIIKKIKQEDFLIAIRQCKKGIIAALEGRNF